MLVGDISIKADVRLASGPYNTSADGTERSEHSAALPGVDTLLFVNQGLL